MQANLTPHWQDLVCDYQFSTSLWVGAKALKGREISQGEGREWERKDQGAWVAGGLRHLQRAGKEQWGGRDAVIMRTTKSKISIQEECSSQMEKTGKLSGFKLKAACSLRAKCLDGKENPC
jgi:hypothetical protein